MTLLEWMMLLGLAILIVLLWSGRASLISSVREIGRALDDRLRGEVATVKETIERETAGVRETIGQARPQKQETIAGRVIGHMHLNHERVTMGWYDSGEPARIWFVATEKFLPIAPRELLLEPFNGLGIYLPAQDHRPDSASSPSPSWSITDPEGHLLKIVPIDVARLEERTDEAIARRLAQERASAEERRCRVETWEASVEAEKEPRMRETAMARAREDPSTWRVTRARSDKAVEHRAEEIFREEWEREKRESKERVRVWEQERASKDSEDQRRRMIRVRLFYVGRVRVGA